MSEHAPTPWTVRDAPGAGWQITAPISGRVEVIDYPHPQPRETYFWDLTDVQFVLISGERWVQFETQAWKEMQAANAAFIVRACNSHDALVAALERVAPHGYRSGALCFCQIKIKESSHHSDRCIAANAALKLAREGQS